MKTTPCECNQWANTGETSAAMMLATGHHEDCPDNPVFVAKKYIAEMGGMPRVKMVGLLRAYDKLLRKWQDSLRYV